MCTWRQEPLFYDIFEQHNPDLSPAIFPTESIRSWTTDTSGILDYVWEQRKNQTRDTACDTRSAKDDLISSTDSRKIMMDMKGKTWILRLGPIKPQWELTAQLSTGDSVKMSVLLQGPDLGQQTLWYKQYYPSVQTNVACDGPTPTAEKLGSANVLNIWNLNLNSVPPGCTWLQDKRVPRRQKSKQTECHTRQSPLNAFANRQRRQLLTPMPMNK